MSARTLTIAAGDDGARVDKVLARTLGLGTAAVRRLCDGGQVRGPRGRLAAGDRVTVGMVVTVADVQWLIAVDGPLEVIAAWADVVVVDKPAGLVCHPLVPGEDDSVVHRLVGRFPDIATASIDPREGGLLHRLDTGTSGCLAVARDRGTWESLRARFDGATKTYLAIVVGVVGPDLTIDSPIGHDRGDRRRMAIDADGAPCGTTVHALGHGRLRTREGAVDVSLVRLGLSGGRRHQLRVHLQSRGHPLLGDTLYGAPASDDGGFFLHAVSLALPGHPLVRAPLPARWRTTLAAAGCPMPTDP
jgi:23S rRNA pseudouridine1911/1915/1917 synthase